jgi:hypothetical protein
MLQHGPPCLAFGQRAHNHAGTMYGHNFSFLSYVVLIPKTRIVLPNFKISDG